MINKGKSKIDSNDDKSMLLPFTTNPSIYSKKQQNSPSDRSAFQGKVSSSNQICHNYKGFIVGHRAGLRKKYLVYRHPTDSV